MTSVALTKDKQLRVVDEEAQGKPQMVPKPRFLEQLEAFLKKELAAMGVVDVGPSELRLQVMPCILFKHISLGSDIFF